MGAFLPSLIGVLLALPSGGQPASAPGEELFAFQVWPLLKARCLPCHGDDAAKLKGGLDLSSLKTARQGGDSGLPALVPGKPEASRLLLAVLRSDPDLKMPPKESDRLTDAQVTAIRRWIEAGASWPPPERIRELAARNTAAPAKGGVTVATSGGLSPEWNERRYDPANLWAYRPLAKPPVPPGGYANPIDAFLGKKLMELGLSPAPAADRRSLIRRVTFDLLGLPPTPEEVAAFLNDPAPDGAAFARVVDRLLASPHYGEHWGRHWLDVARYADSAGLANDYERGNAWRYRDYVVRAFNQDRPYDQFVREQLAGDEIDPANPELLVAVGFLRMGPWELTGMEVPRVARQRFLDDVTETVGMVFLAHPLQCARCHDHKFDPVPTRDYYRIQAAFATTQLAERPAPFLAAENLAGFEERRYLETRMARLEALAKAIDDKEERAARAWCAEKGIPYVPRNEGLRKGIKEELLPPRHIGLDIQDLGLERIARKGIERLRWELERYEPVALSVYSGKTPRLKAVLAPQRMPVNRMSAGDLENSAILAGGDPFSPRAPVTPGTLSVLSPGKASDLPVEIEGRRRALADWLTRGDGKHLAARVMVNRIWQGHFGRGLAANPNNFGATGKKPTHPELLDWLAAEFIDRGWSVKAMHRLILGSDAYRRGSTHPQSDLLAAHDPENASYARFPPRRLTAEEIRDAMLWSSGELNPALGGIPARPELNPDVALQPRQVMGTFAAAWEPSTKPSERHRRSLYVLRLRGLRDPFFEVFNQPGPDSSCECRESSTVTPQVFSLLHGDASRGRALAFAARLKRETATPEAAIERAFHLALARPPTAAERQACLDHWRRMTERHRTLVLKMPVPVKQVEREAVEENTGQKFTYVEVLDRAAGFVPDLSAADADPELRGLMEVCLVLFNANEFIYVD